jgi:hypothetical protein
MTRRLRGLSLMPLALVATACATAGAADGPRSDAAPPHRPQASALPPPCPVARTLDGGLRVVETDGACEVPGVPQGTDVALFATLAWGDEPEGLAGLAAALAEVSLEAAPRGGRAEEASLASLALAHAAEAHAVADSGRVGWALRLADPAAVRPLLDALAALALELRASSNLVATWAERRGLHVDDGVAASAWATSIAAGHDWPVGVGITRPLLSRLHREDLVRLHRRLFVRGRLTVVVPRGTDGEALAALAAIPPGSAPEPAAPCATPLGRTFHLETRRAAPTLHAARVDALSRPDAGRPAGQPEEALFDRLDVGLRALRPLFDARGAFAAVHRIEGTAVLVADAPGLAALGDLARASPPVLPALLGDDTSALLTASVDALRLGVTVSRGPEAPSDAVLLPRTPRRRCAPGASGSPRHPAPTRITLQDGTTGVISVPNFKAKPGDAPARARANHDAHRDDEANR